MGLEDRGRLVPWRKVARKAALEASVIKIQVKWGCTGRTFNYRWEHVQAVVRTGVRLAKLVGADVEIVDESDQTADMQVLARRNGGDFVGVSR